MTKKYCPVCRSWKNTIYKVYKGEVRETLRWRRDEAKVYDLEESNIDDLRFELACKCGASVVDKPYDKQVGVPRYCSIPSGRCDRNELIPYSKSGSCSRCEWKLNRKEGR